MAPHDNGAAYSGAWRKDATIHREQPTAREGSGQKLSRRDPATIYGLVVVLLVAAVQLFFSLDRGGYFLQQWYWGAVAVSIALVASIFVPGYFSTGAVGRKQWALAGTLLLFAAVVAASISWSISRELSFYEASRTAMYVGAFVLLLPAATRWGTLIVDATLFGAFLPPAIFGLLQKVFPTLAPYTGFYTLETDPRASSTIGYHPTFGLMCAMGALLALSRANSLRSIPLRGLYSIVSVILLVALYFTFSRGALLAFAGGAFFLLLLSKNRFEALGNLIISVFAALWTVSQARGLPGLVARPVSLQAMEADGWQLVGLLLQGILAVFVAQVVLTILIRWAERAVAERVRRGFGMAGAVVAAGLILAGLGWGVATLGAAGGIAGLEEKILAQEASGSEALARDQSGRFASVHAGNRIVLWKIAWENWREHPLTGTGADTYQVVYEKKKPENFGDVLQPHSIWMSLLSDTGIFAFLAFAAFSVGLLALACYDTLSSTRSRRSRALIAGGTAAAAAYLVSSSVDWNWHIPACTLPFFALVAVAVGNPRRKGSRPRHVDGR